jgi:alpha-galactosidase
VRLMNTTNEIDQGRDFASEVGVGAVVGTKFTWPDYGKHFKIVELTPGEKESFWKKWIGIYQGKMLSRGEFLDLYTYGYDFPEAYAIGKDGRVYYAFYADKGKRWSGEIELRGLNSGTYQVIDYENGTALGSVDASTPKLKVTFFEHLLLEVSPAAPHNP